MKEIRVSEASEMVGMPEVPVPEMPDEPFQTFEEEYYSDKPKGARRDIAQLAIDASNDTLTLPEK